VPAGTYVLTAKVTDSLGLSAMSAPVTVVVNYTNQPPTITLTAPLNNTWVWPHTTITLTADATDDLGVAKVEFYCGEEKIGEATTAPYTCTYTVENDCEFSARVYDSDGVMSVSSNAWVYVRQPLMVYPYMPEEMVFGTPGAITVQGYISNPNYTPIATVEIFANGVKVGETTAAYYDGGYYLFVWNDVPSGSYTITVTATDSVGNTGSSTPVTATVQEQPNIPPSVSIAYPYDGSTFTGPTSIYMTVSASDADGTVRTVEIYDGATLLAIQQTSEYYWYNWENIPSGVHTFTAVATDDKGATITSNPVTITVE
jgi:chitinase